MEAAETLLAVALKSVMLRVWSSVESDPESVPLEEPPEPSLSELWK